MLTLGERDCSIQRRHQKLIEETPSPGVTPAPARRARGRRGAGLRVDALPRRRDARVPGRRRRVLLHRDEHAAAGRAPRVTELVTGIDLVRGQIRVAAGEGLPATGRAERSRPRDRDPDQRGGPVARLPAGAGHDHAIPSAARGRACGVDTHVYEGYTIPPTYDSLLAKLVVWDEDRPRSLARAGPRTRRARARGAADDPGPRGRDRRQRGLPAGRLHDRVSRRCRGATSRPSDAMSGRRAARRQALFLLYQWDLTGQPLASLHEGEIDPFARTLAEEVVESAPPTSTGGSPQPRAAGRPTGSASSSATSSAWRSASSTAARCPVEVAINEAVELWPSGSPRATRRASSTASSANRAGGRIACRGAHGGSCSGQRVRVGRERAGGVRPSVCRACSTGSRTPRRRLEEAEDSRGRGRRAQGPRRAGEGGPGRDRATAARGAGCTGRMSSERWRRPSSTSSRSRPISGGWRTRCATRSSAGASASRPVLCLATGEALGREPGELLPAACALELVHTFSLVHDDLPALDDDDLRRGQPSAHVAFGEAVAILGGDALLAEAFRLALRVSDPGACPRARRGDARDDRRPVRRHHDERRARRRRSGRLHRLKTGKLLGACVGCALEVAARSGLGAGALARVRRRDRSSLPDRRRHPRRDRDRRGARQDAGEGRGGRQGHLRVGARPRPGARDRRRDPPAGRDNAGRPSSRHRRCSQSSSRPSATGTPSASVLASRARRASGGVRAGRARSKTRGQTPDEVARSSFRSCYEVGSLGRVRGDGAA